MLGQQVSTAYEQGWAKLSNGTLIAAAETAGFDIFVTTDRNLKYQQNLKDRKLAIFVLPTTSWPKLRVVAADIAACVMAVKSGDFIEYSIP